MFHVPMSEGTPTTGSIPCNSLENSNTVQSIVQHLSLPPQGEFSELQIQSNLIEKVLHDSLDGQALLVAARSQRGFTESQRRTLGKLIVNHIIGKNPSLKIPQNTFFSLSIQIEKLFPKERASLYYTPYVAADKYAKKKNASGILYEAYVGRRRSLRNSGILPQVRSKLNSATSTQVLTEILDQHCDLIEVKNEVVQDSIVWLRSNVTPWASVVINWRHTAQYRAKELDSAKSSITICEYFNRYPALKQPEGYQLLLDDFADKYPNTPSLQSAICLVQETIIELGRDKCKNNKCKDFKQETSKYLRVISNSWPESKGVAALLLLPYVLNAPNRLCGKWKPSRSEVRDAFITCVASDNDLLLAINERRNKCAVQGIPFQPLVGVIGNLDFNCKACVVVDETIYRFRSVLQAVDVAFRIFHATGARYPPEAVDVWLSIQLIMYSIKTNFDRPSLAVQHLQASLAVHNDTQSV